MKLILRKGFTLIELMIAIVIMAILSATSVSLYHTQLMKQQRAEGTAFAQYIQAPVQTFTVEEGRFPTTSELYTDLRLADSPSGQLSRFKYINRLLSEVKRAKEGTRGVLYVVFSSEVSADLAEKVIKLEYDSSKAEGWSCTTDISQQPLEGCSVVKKIDVPTPKGPQGGPKGP